MQTFIKIVATVAILALGALALLGLSAQIDRQVRLQKLLDVCGHRCD